MFTILTVAIVFIALVLGAVHWKMVREALLWLSAIIFLFTTLAAVIAFVIAIVKWDAVPAYIGLALLAVSGVLGAIEQGDRDKQFAKWRASLQKRDD